MYIPNDCINTLIYVILPLYLKETEGEMEAIATGKKCHPSSGPSNFNRSCSKSPFLMGKP
jgi:hypothetical protein